MVAKLGDVCGGLVLVPQADVLRQGAGQPASPQAALWAQACTRCARRSGRPELATRALSLLQRLPNMRLVPIEVELSQLAGRFAADQALRGADAVYVSLAYRLGIPLVTWDRQQRERGPANASVFTLQDLLAP